MVPLRNASTDGVTTMLHEMLASITGRFRRQSAAIRRIEPPEPPLVDLCHAIIATRAESSTLVLVQRLLDRYELLSPADKQGFFEMLRDRFGVDRPAVAEAAARLGDSNDYGALERFYTLAEPVRQKLLRRLNQGREGTARLIEMRADLLRLVEDHPSLREVDYDLRHLFQSWFNSGFLELRRIDWDTSASILGKIIEYEAVHEIRGWDDLRSRIDPPDRRLYAFFHPRLPGEPLVFVEVALCAEAPANIADILQPGREPLAADKAKTAVFYSISSCQEGLKGITFGNLLIKQVVANLRAELPGLDSFVTLSPVPGFGRWLREAAESGPSPIGARAGAVLAATGKPDWWVADGREALGADLRLLAAHYLLAVRRGGNEPHDPVARFHLGNGARLERINWPGNLTEAGLKGSRGVMVNYLYRLEDIERNSEAYFETGAVIASPKVEEAARQLALETGRTEARA